MIDVHRISWDEVMRMTVQLSKKMRGKHIWGVPRGGSIVAAIMSFHDCVLVAAITEADVVVDDIADSGRTLQELRSPTAALVVRSSACYKPTYWTAILNTSAYVLFPWEDEKAVELQNGFRSRDS